MLPSANHYRNFSSYGLLIGSLSDNGVILLFFYYVFGLQSLIKGVTIAILKEIKYSKESMKIKCIDVMNEFIYLPLHLVFKGVIDNFGEDDLSQFDRQTS